MAKALKNYIKGTTDHYLANLILDRHITDDSKPTGPDRETKDPSS